MTAGEVANRQAATSLDSVLKALREAAAKDKAFQDVCYVFSIRERARQTVSVDALVAQMKKEGFEHKRAQYVEVLKTLARLGIGRLETTKGGGVKGLIDVKYKIQSIGAAAVNPKEKVEAFKQKNKFIKLDSFEALGNAVKPQATTGKSATAAPVAQPRPTTPAPNAHALATKKPSVPVQTTNGVILLDLPRPLTNEEYARLVARMYDRE